MSNDDLLIELLGEVREMKGGLNEFKEQTKQQLTDIRNRLEVGDIHLRELEKKIIGQGSVCPLHSKIDVDLKSQQREIGELKTSNAVQEYKLNEKQEKQLNLTSLGTVGSIIYTVLKLILAPFGIHLP